LQNEYPDHNVILQTVAAYSVSCGSSGQSNFLENCLQALIVSKAAQNSSVYNPQDAAIFQLSSDADQAFFLENILSLSNNDGANTGEVLRIATQIIPSNSEEATYQAYYPMAQAIDSLAQSIDPLIDPVGARQNYFHASTYYRAASNYLVKDPSDPRLVSLWDQQTSAFDKAVALLKPAPGEKFTVHADNSSIGPYDIPAYFFKAHADVNKRNPTLVLTTGYDGSMQEAYHSQCVQVLLRGLNCVVYEGPGQPSLVRYQNKTFIPDWWTATTPVVDYISNRSDVDTSKIVLMGISYGGTLAPRAASQEPRIAAVIQLDGLSSLQHDLRLQFPIELDELFDSGKQAEFDEILTGLANNQSQPIYNRYFIQQGLYAFGTKSPFEWFTRLGPIVITKEVVQGVGSRPVYIAEGEVSVSPI
jgi:pimeloyl-ACP methyl ester carboxylesterase